MVHAASKEGQESSEAAVANGRGLHEAETVAGRRVSGEARAAAKRPAVDIVLAGWRLFDPEGKGHIDDVDMRRVCLQMGVNVTAM